MNALAECRPQVENLVARILRRKKDDPDVQDCTNETLRRALEHAERGTVEQRERTTKDAFVPWVLGVARHVALDALRAEYRRRTRSGAATRKGSDTPSNDDLVSQLPDTTFDPESLAASRQGVRHLEEALECLPAQQRAALLALHVEGLSYREAAEQLGVPVATIGTWVLRARQTLLEALPNVAQSHTARGPVTREPT